ncbi:type II toxin-antitoxin system RelE/ParE family toxin [Flavobacterium sp. MFBS3-15]|uniref:type II toxin-antitoxin system RelE/ParE family toxin n=1 Tax=Flavobacterium sp. MFBS3-15 TaxID=2989816 RepID=UPI002236219B|nr:type II toxin-antitoxin system RelE/ParE family toxin [Flavobacterium sp. MFBS3-15]MCW4467970.1 type II toxin-antitoxin system RelE/ParE family toxin [Flavobacterium sp. MFBS3-15]
MEKVNWSKRSVNSLNKIWRFYAEKAGVVVADKIVLEIISEAESIIFASQYQNEEFLNNGQRRAIVRHFKVIYTFTGDVFRIYNIFDSRQNPKKLK